MDGNNKEETTMAFTSFVMLPADVRHLLMAGALSVHHPTPGIKSVVQTRYGNAGQDVVAAPSVPGTTSGAADTELSCRSHLRPRGSTSATRCPVHRTWNQRLRLPVFQHMSTSWPTQGEFCYCQFTELLFAFEFLVHRVWRQIFAFTKTKHMTQSLLRYR